MNVLNEDASREVDNDTIDTTRVLEISGKENPEKASEIEDKQAELLRKAKLEDEIRESTIFKNLQSNLNGQYNLEEMIPMIVENYLNMASTPVINTVNVPISIDSEILRVAFGEFIYLVSVIENGIVLDSAGEIDVQATLEQRQMMTYKQFSAKELMDLDSVVISDCEDMSMQEKMQLLLSDNVKEQILGTRDIGLTSFYSVEKSMMEMNELLREEAIFEVYKISQSEELKKEEEEKADKCFYNSKKEVKYDMNLVEALAFMHGEGEEKDFLNLQTKMWKKGNYNWFFNHDGKLNEERIKSYLQEKADSYVYKEHKQFIDSFLKDSACEYDGYLLNSCKRRLLYSIYDVASKEESVTRDYAFKAMMIINPDLIKEGEDGKKEINIDVLLDEFRKAGKVFSSKEELDLKNEDYNLDLFQKKVESLNRNKDFEDVEYTTEAEKRAKQKSIKEKGKEKEKRTTHQGTKVYRTEAILDEVLCQRSQEEKSAIIALAYVRAIQTKNTIREDFLGDYMLEHREEFKAYEEILEGTAGTTEFDAIQMIPDNVYVKLLADDSIISKVSNSLKELEDRKTREEKSESFLEFADGIKAHAENLFGDVSGLFKATGKNLQKMLGRGKVESLPVGQDKKIEESGLDETQKTNIIIPLSKELITSKAEQAVQSWKKTITIEDLYQTKVRIVKTKEQLALKPETMKSVHISFDDRYKIPKTLDEAVAAGVKPSINSGRVKEDSEMGDSR